MCGTDQCYITTVLQRSWPDFTVLGVVVLCCSFFLGFTECCVLLNLGCVLLNLRCDLLNLVLCFTEPWIHVFDWTLHVGLSDWDHTCVLASLQETVTSHKAKWANHIATLNGSAGRLYRSVRGRHGHKLCCMGPYYAPRMSWSSWFGMGSHKITGAWCGNGLSKIR